MGFLSNLFRRSPTVTFGHPVFGTLTLESGAKGPYWMHEVYEGENGISISIDTRDAAEPTQLQIDFFQRVTTDLDSVVGPVLSELGERHKEIYGENLPSDWRLAFTLAGVGVPLDGDPNAEWDIALECLTNNSKFLYTCYFEEGKLTHVSVDT